MSCTASEGHPAPVHYLCIWIRLVLLLLFPLLVFLEGLELLGVQLFLQRNLE